MRPSLADAVDELERATELVRKYAELDEWKTASEAARVVLSAGSKLHQRLSLLAELYDAGEFTAQVDRAIARARQTVAAPEEIPGQQTLGLKPARPARGKGKSPK